MADGLSKAPEQAAEMDWDAASQILAKATHGADDGELFVEDSKTESFYWDDGRLKSASFDATQGFGLRIPGQQLCLGCPKFGLSRAPNNRVTLTLSTRVIPERD